jgi:hypothetical protein
MRKRLTLAATVLLLLCVSVAFAHHGPDKVTVSAAAAKQPAVTFDHKAHATKLVKSCDTCHHNHKGLSVDNAAKTKVQKCSSCHLDPKDGAPSMREASLQKNPFHNAGCINCHKEQKKGPVACTGCHKKA